MASTVLQGQIEGNGLALSYEEGSFDDHNFTQSSSSSSFLSRFLLYIGAHELFSKEVCFNSIYIYFFNVEFGSNLFRLCSCKRVVKKG